MIYLRLHKYSRDGQILEGAVDLELEARSEWSEIKATTITTRTAYREEEQIKPIEPQISNSLHKTTTTATQTHQSEILRCAWYANGSGVFLILSKLTTVSCNDVIALFIAVADAGVNNPCLINDEK